MAAFLKPFNVFNQITLCFLTDNTDFLYIDTLMKLTLFAKWNKWSKARYNMFDLFMILTKDIQWLAHEGDII